MFDFGFHNQILEDNHIVTMILSQDLNSSGYSFKGTLLLMFQEPGDIEAEFERLGVKEVMKNFLAFRKPGPLYFPKGKGFDYSAERPPWLTEEELDYYATKFEQTGFTGGVNYYRAFGL